MMENCKKKTKKKKTGERNATGWKCWKMQWGKKKAEDAQRKNKLRHSKMKQRNYDYNDYVILKNINFP